MEYNEFLTWLTEPGPIATTVACSTLPWDFSGSMMPPFVTVSAVKRSTSTRSNRGKNFLKACNKQRRFFRKHQLLQSLSVFFLYKKSLVLDLRCQSWLWQVNTVTLKKTDNERGGGEEEGHVPLNNGIQAKGRSSSLNVWLKGTKTMTLEKILWLNTNLKQL